MKLVNKRSNYLVSFTVFLNFAKTEANTIVKGSLIVNTGRGIFFFRLGSLIIYDLGGEEVLESKDFV